MLSLLALQNWLNGMTIAFEKYHGTGNDFILIDIRNRAIPEDADIIAHWCDRRFGIGADGLITLGLSDTHDFNMKYYNSDGRLSSMCGNGGRCIIAFARQLGLISTETSFSAPDGEHRGSILSSHKGTYRVSLQMSDVRARNWDDKGIFLDTGSPHYVLMQEDLQNLDVAGQGKKIRNDPAFAPGGTNVNFMEVKKGVIHLRTYERGVEDETLSCGTGVTAAAIAYSLKTGYDNGSTIVTRGGKLSVSFSRKDMDFSEIYLQGPAVHVFSGTLEL